VAIENRGAGVTFPHVLPTDTTRLFTEVVYTPFIDELTAAAALAGVQAMELGRGPQTDLLAVSLSGSDYVGHRYGPDSREVHDNMLRLDRTLGTFIDSLYALRDSSTIVFALSADHGVTSFPEVAAARTGRAPARYDLAPAVRTLRASLRAAGVDTLGAVSLDGGLVFVDREHFRRAGVNPDPILARFAAEVRRMPLIARVDRVRDITARDTVRDQVMRRWARMIPADSPVEWVITARHGAYPRTYTSAMHGEPYDDDAKVPVIFYGPWFKAGRYRQRALVADIAPTLARVAGVPPTERLDGRVRAEALSASVPR
jgi:predicted AlkP superfamily pyrophosphatase or phosphodiesterase